MNFLTVMLCIAMGRPYQFYQFVPLATFAFVMQYIILISPPQITSRDVDINPWKYSYMFVKFFIFGFVSTLLYMSQVSTFYLEYKNFSANDIFREIDFTIHVKSE